jgi:hypothetical protein
MAGTLLPAAQALERYFPDAASIEAMPGGVDPKDAKVLVIEGDLVIDRAGLIQTASALDPRARLNNHLKQSMI